MLSLPSCNPCLPGRSCSSGRCWQLCAFYIQSAYSLVLVHPLHHFRHIGVALTCCRNAASEEPAADLCALLLQSHCNSLLTSVPHKS